MSRPARVMFAIPELDAGGPDRVFYELLLGLDRQRIEPILVVSRARGRYFDQLPGDVQVECIGGGRYPVLRFARAVDRLLPDLVFTTLRMNVTAATATYVQKHRAPLIVRQANAIAADFALLKKTSLLKHRLAERVVRRLLRRPDVLVAQSMDMAKELAGEADSRQSISVIGNPVSLEEIDHEFNRQRKAARTEPWGEPAIVAVGRLAPQKGFDILIPAFALLRQDLPGARLTIWGEGAQRSTLEAQVTELRLGEFVRLPGRTETALNEIGAADMLVSASRYEGFSNVILEAMALGTPVVATDCPGATRELVIDGETGFLVRELDERALAAGMARACGVSRAVVASSAKAHLSANFDKSAIIRSYEDLFDSHLAN